MPDYKIIELKMDARSNYRDVKEKVHKETKIAPADQIWAGWPNNVSDKTILANIDLTVNYELRSAKSIAETSGRREGEEVVVEPIIIDSDIDSGNPRKVQEYFSNATKEQIKAEPLFKTFQKLVREDLNAFLTVKDILNK